MRNQRRGMCLVFNIQKFESLCPRYGGDVDAENLKRCFGALGFQVMVFKDYTTFQIFDTLRKVALADHTNEDCFVCCILTHGGATPDGNEYLCGSEGSFNYNRLYDPFKDNVCPTLRGKPKLFFIQACRGTKVDNGVKLKKGYDMPDHSNHSMLTNPDFLLAISTVPGYFSFRNTVDGSHFITNLCATIDKSLRNNDEELELMNILRQLNRKMAYDFQSNVPNHKKWSGKKQMSCFITTLTKQLVFPHNTSTPSKVKCISTSR
ncbi:caspase-3-like [Tachypleus tridentatus]|uniref:caspase-3-like n=1 Tax=Tachypleus tridentatus TaxID=6853 RepID=UPI003FD4D0AC